MAVQVRLHQAVVSALHELYQQTFAPAEVTLQQTKPEFEGDYTVVLFNLLKPLRKSPDALGQELGAYLKQAYPELVSSYSIVKGFLNLSISTRYWMDVLTREYGNKSFGKQATNGKTVVVEYSSPNTNKPLHLGHLRNNFLGWSIAEIYKANGYRVVKTCIVNDRGIHICKSMLAWQKWGNGATPESTGLKGDHLVGDYYVLFEKELKKQTEPLMQEVMQGNLDPLPEGELRDKVSLLLEKLEQSNLPDEKKEEARDAIREIVRNQTPIMQEVREMLIQWEKGDPATIQLWKQMNQWVYEGFDATYQRIGSDFDKIYYESDTYLLGKDFVLKGLEQQVFFRKEDGSVWIDLTADGLDQKLVLRKDGTSVYMTQDLGLAQKKYEDFRMDQSIYVIGNEQDYHMQALRLICGKLGLPNASGIHHLSYGMVELPTGKMKSREGTVVDADDLLNEMEEISASHTRELGKVQDFSEAELKELYSTIGVGALKFYLLRVDPKKRMVFNPEESIDFHGYTGPFIQYTHARIKSILRREPIAEGETFDGMDLLPLEKELITLAERYPQMVIQAGEEQNPSVLANYAFTLAKTFNSFYAEHSVMQAETSASKQLRLRICGLTALILSSAMQLLGIRVPERM